MHHNLLYSYLSKRKPVLGLHNSKDIALYPSFIDVELFTMLLIDSDMNIMCLRAELDHVGIKSYIFPNSVSGIKECLAEASFLHSRF